MGNSYSLNSKHDETAIENCSFSFVRLGSSCCSWLFELLRVERILRVFAKDSPRIAKSSPRIAKSSPRIEKSSKSILEKHETLRIFSPNEKTNRSVAVDPEHFHLENFLRLIFDWNPNCLEVKNQTRGTPSFADEDELVATLPVYRTYEEYYRIVGPLLSLELWHGISRTYQEEKKIPWRYRISTCKTEIFLVHEEKLYVSVLELYIEGIYKELPVHGDLVIFNYTSKRRHECGFPVQKAFAYVARVQKGGGPYTVLTKPWVDAELKCGDLQPVSYIRPTLRSVQALRYLPKSPLGIITLHPRIMYFRLPATNNLDDYPLVTKDCLNERQLEAVTKITAAVVQELPRICLIHGPPGTGKSRVIVNLITQIIHSKRRLPGYKKKRILICAPSNTAVDEVVLRLMSINRSLKERGELPFSLVRVGCVDKMDPLVKEILPRELATKHVERISLNDKLMYDPAYERKKKARIFFEEERLLIDADVIACTLTSCYTDKMESMFGQSKAISVCIVDEATQSVEPDTLIPLMLGVKTLILVGDTNQLPATVLSQKAKKLGLDQSLFARISKIFEREPDNPIIKLDTQYRMSSPIALFPNRHFYDGALKNAAKECGLPLHFYRVFNLNATQSADKFSNCNEADFVANLMYALIARAHYGNAILPVSVGVITPYNNQKTLLRKKISKRISCLKYQSSIDYKVDTIDSFQGQERDVMIMSCVRSQGIGFLADRQRLCVALTRAKHSLILCGNFKTFERDPTWKALLKDAKERKVYIDLQASANPDVIMTFIAR
ncbi:helicase sen1 isoform X2 [Cephus cinctus]|uniref:Helicase sen1 isoform X2 n=1 Tax=Cephus cinctus TaxID=211228 RepID=A0AAJ7BQI1_CEPCN|nr:helicase sen1 isoform X2 [Cephus cinctus]